jgi:Protein adenylyltransferase SelO
MSRYAYGNQPRIAQWNLARFAEALLPLLAEDTESAVALAQEVIDAFAYRFEAAYTDGLRRKLGLLKPEAGDLELAQGLLKRMADNGADFTLTFRRLCDTAAGLEGNAGVRSLFAGAGAFDEWARLWRQRLAREEGEPAARQAAMRAANPAYIPRNHLVEEAIAAASEGDFTPFESLLQVISAPYQDQRGFEHYAEPPGPDQVVRETFCGTQAGTGPGVQFQTSCHGPPVCFASPLCHRARGYTFYSGGPPFAKNQAQGGPPQGGSYSGGLRRPLKVRRSVQALRPYYRRISRVVPVTGGVSIWPSLTFLAHRREANGFCNFWLFMLMPVRILSLQADSHPSERAKPPRF